MSTAPSEMIPKSRSIAPRRIPAGPRSVNNWRAPRIRIVSSNGLRRSGMQGLPQRFVASLRSSSQRFREHLKGTQVEIETVHGNDDKGSGENFPEALS